MKPFLVFLLLLNVQFVFAQTSVDKEIKIGDDYAKQVEQEMGIWNNAAMQQYINNVGQRLVNTLGPQPYSYTFQIVDQWEPNAFSIPGGHVYVSRGLLVLLKSESELAGVLGHEIGHIIRHHSMKQQQHAVFASVLAVPAVVIGTLTQNQNLENLLLVPALGVSKVYLAKYGRGQEYEADQVGLQIAANAGYDTHGLQEILERLEDDITLLNKGQAHSYSIFDDHPMTPDRVKRLDKLSTQLTQKRIADLKSGDEFTKVWDGLMYGPNPNEGVFLNNEFLHYEMNLYVVFPQDWVYLNEKDAVGAYTRDKKSMIALTISMKGNKADSLHGKAIDKLKQNQKIISDSSRSTINGHHVATLSYTDVNEQGVKIYTCISWIEKDGQTWALISQSTTEIKKEYQATLHSVEGLKDAEKHRIKVLVVRVNKLPSTENIDQLNARTGNRFEEPMFLIVNGAAKREDLKENEVVKVLVEENYVK